MSKEFNKAVGKKKYIARIMHGYNKEEFAFWHQFRRVLYLILKKDVDTMREKADMFGIWK